MTTEAEDTYVPGWTTLVHAKAAPSFGESAVRQDAAAGRIGPVMGATRRPCGVRNHRTVNLFESESGNAVASHVV